LVQISALNYREFFQFRQLAKPGFPVEAGNDPPSLLSAMFMHKKLKLWRAGLALLSNELRISDLRKKQL
jgi:hypothetical protein